MHTLSATIDAHIDQEAVLTAVLEALPEGSTARIDQEPIIVAGADLDDTHIGTSIRGNVGKDHEFAGVIEHVYPGEGGGHMLIVDGKPHTVQHYDVVQITPPYTEGAHTPDEPAIVEEEEFDMTADDYNSAISLAAQTELAVSRYAVPVAGWLTRPTIEAVVGRPLDDDEFALVAHSVSAHFTEVVNAIAVPIIARHWTLFEAIEQKENADD